MKSLLLILIYLFFFVSSPSFASSELYNAVLDLDVQRVRECLERGDTVDFINVDDFSYTPLLIASVDGHTEIVELLLDYGANADTFSGGFMKMTPLMKAITFLHKDLLKLLLQRGANVNLAHENHFSPLMHASFGVGDPEDIVTLLLDYGARASINDISQRGHTALSLACKSRNIKVVKLLLVHGATYTNDMIPQLVELLGDDAISYISDYQVALMQALQGESVITQNLPTDVLNHINGFLVDLGVIGINFNEDYFAQRRCKEEYAAQRQKVLKRIYQAFTVALMFSLHASVLNSL